MLDNAYSFNDGCAVALGSFDGLHLGHRSLIAEAVASKCDGLFAVALTFSAPPKRASRIITPARKEYLLRSLGIDTVFELDFASVRRMSPEEFFNEILIGSLNARKIVCGEDYRFGAAAAGDTELLEKLCLEAGVELCVCKTVTAQNGEKISSSLIRDLIRRGRVDEATEFLGLPFCLDGEVTEGKGLGHSLGFPTVNQKIGDGMILPKDGVYATRIFVGGKTYAAVTNVGRQPTVDGSSRTVETHIIGYEGDLYGWMISVEFVKRLRGVRKFPSVEALTQAIGEDAKAAKELVKVE